MGGRGASSGAKKANPFARSKFAPTTKASSGEGKTTQGAAQSIAFDDVKKWVRKSKAIDFVNGGPDSININGVKLDYWPASINNSTRNGTKHVSTMWQGSEKLPDGTYPTVVVDVKKRGNKWVFDRVGTRIM